MHMCVHVCVCIRVCACVCACIHWDVHIDLRVCSRELIVISKLQRRIDLVELWQQGLEHVHQHLDVLGLRPFPLRHHQEGVSSDG